jgi:hypothetical protein
MENKIIRKYNSNFRKNIKQKITKLVDKRDFVTIYKIINLELESKLSINRNGIYFNLNLLTDECIEKLIMFLDDIFNKNEILSEDNKIKYKPYIKDNLNNNEYNNEYKLSNQERSLLKKFHQI